MVIEWSNTAVLSNSSKVSVPLKVPGLSPAQDYILRINEKRYQEICLFYKNDQPNITITIQNVAITSKKEINYEKYTKNKKQKNKKQFDMCSISYFK